ncbi:MAG: efflux RND transporter periplasmic adaptor subunit [Planctomycetota bacterium]
MHRLLFAALALPLALACQPSEAGGDDAPVAGGVKQRELPRVRVAPVERRAMASRLETTSKLESEREILMIPRSSGLVVELFAEEGDAVREGDVLARLDDLDPTLAVRDAEVASREASQAIELAKLVVEENRARLDAARITRAQADRDYQRDLVLHEGRGEEDAVSALSQKALEATRLAKDNADSEVVQAELALRKAELDVVARENALARAQVALERAEVALEQTKLVAPIDGVVAERQLRVGAMASSAEPAFVLTDPTRLRAIFYRPQEEYALFRGAARGHSANGDARLTFRATSEAWPGETFTGWIERVSPTLDAESSQFRVTAFFDQAGDLLLPGMLVRLEIETDQHADALVVPKRALRREGERRFVFAVRDERLVRVDVFEELDFADTEFIEVRPEEAGALVPGDEIVVIGSRDLVAGDPVRIDAPALAADAR